MNEHDVSKESLALQLRALVSKHEVGHIFWNGDSEQVTLSIGHDGDVEDWEKLQTLHIQNGHTLEVPISQLGTWKERSAQKIWTRKNKKRNIALNVKFDSTSVRAEDFKRELDARLPQLKEHFPGYEIGAEIADEKVKESKEWMLRTLSLCILGIFFVLALQLHSLIQPLVVCSSILFGFIGSLWAIYLHGYELQLMAMIGLLGVAGVAVNDSVLMVDHMNQLAKKADLDLKSIFQGACERLRPIILTTITTLGGLFPMAYAVGGDSGFTRPMAMSMAWGLSSSTLLTLFAIPVFSAINLDIRKFFNRAKKKLHKVQVPRRFRGQKRRELLYDT